MTDPELIRQQRRRHYERHREAVKARTARNQAARKSRGWRIDADAGEWARLEPAMSYAEIGAALGLSTSRVGQLVAQALRKMRASMADTITAAQAAQEEQ